MPVSQKQPVSLSVVPVPDVVLTTLPSDGHGLHPALPGASLYLPTAHAVHVSPFAPVYPALQVHCVAVIDCAGEFEFASMDEHSVHAWNPVELLYVPAAQGPQLGPVKPASHSLCTQSLDDELPLGDVVELGQARHTDGPIVDLYVPAAHKTQL